MGNDMGWSYLMMVMVLAAALVVVFLAFRKLTGGFKGGHDPEDSSEYKTFYKRPDNPMPKSLHAESYRDTYLNVDKSDEVIDVKALKAVAYAMKPLDYQWRVMPERGTEIQAIIKEKDKNFKPVPVLDMARDLYTRLQHCWAEEDTTDVASQLTPEYLEELNQMIEAAKKKSCTTHIESIRFQKSHLCFYKAEEGKEYLTVYVEAQMVRYAISNITGLVVSGSKDELEYMVNLMKFVRPEGSQSEEHNWLLCDFKLSGKKAEDEGVIGKAPEKAPYRFR